MSKKYRIVIQKSYDTEFEVEAENEEEAVQKADDKFDELNILGSEMYYANYEVVEEEND